MPEGELWRESSLAGQAGAAEEDGAQGKSSFGCGGGSSGCLEQGNQITQGGNWKGQRSVRTQSGYCHKSLSINAFTAKGGLRRISILFWVWG